MKSFKEFRTLNFLTQNNSMTPQQIYRPFLPHDFVFLSVLRWLLFSQALLALPVHRPYLSAGVLALTFSFLIAFLFLQILTLSKVLSLQALCSTSSTHIFSIGPNTITYCSYGEIIFPQSTTLALIPGMSCGKDQ